MRDSEAAAPRTSSVKPADVATALGQQQLFGEQGHPHQQLRPGTAPAYGGSDAQQHLSSSAGSSPRRGYAHAPGAGEWGAAGPYSPPGRPTSGGFLRGLKQSSGCLTGLMQRSRPSSPAPAGSPMFEVRGASLLAGGPAEAGRPTTPKGPSHQAYEGSAHVSGSGRSGTAATGQPAGSGVYNLHARAGYAAMHRTSSGSGGSPRSNPSGSSPYSSPQRAQQPQQQQQQQQQQPRPRTPAVEVVTTAAHQQQQHVARNVVNPPASPTRASAAVSASAATASGDSSARSSASGADSAAPYTTYHVPLSTTSSSQASAAAGGGAGAAPAHMHSNPLFTAADVVGAQQAAIAGGWAMQQQGGMVMGMAGLTISTQVPASPKTTMCSSAGGTPSAHLQAASNLTLLNDSRPISPGPYSYVSGAGSGSGSRPVSPHFFDQPPTPGSFAVAAEAPGAAPYSSLSPTKAAAAGVQQAAGAAAMPPVGFRTPIYNRDGKFVGWKQNSNYMRPLGVPASLPSSVPSSPTKGFYSMMDQSETGDVAVAVAAAPATAVVAAAAATLAAAPAAIPPAGLQSQQPVDSEFAEYAAEPYKGFPDEDNQIPGYVLGPVLGKGGFCSVRKALHELTGRTVACKIIEKTRLKDPKDRDRVDRECRVMRNLSNHVCVVKMYEVAETPEFVYIMMEHCTKGSLLEYVRDKKKLPEEEAAVVLQQLLHSLQFCHRKDVVHRDIKLENILIDGDGNMKLIDFGLCGYFVQGKRLRCHCGSPSYAAPEIVARKDYLGPPVDVWSLGIVLFAMLAGYLPFHAKEKKQLSEKILTGVYKPASWMSPEAVDLVQRMLTLEPEKRITLEEVWVHPWVARSRGWEPPGVGSNRLYRMLTDPSTGSILPDEAVLAQLAELGLDGSAVRRSLRMRECNALTAAYHLMHEAHAERAAKHAAAAAAAVAAVVAKHQQQEAAEREAGWDLSSLSPSRQAATRPKTASATSSPSRFHQEAGSPLKRPPVVPGGAKHVVPPPPAEQEPGGFTIKAIHSSGSHGSPVRPPSALLAPAGGAVPGAPKATALIEGSGAADHLLQQQQFAANQAATGRVP